MTGDRHYDNSQTPSERGYNDGYYDWDCNPPYPAGSPAALEYVKAYGEGQNDAIEDSYDPDDGYDSAEDYRAF